MQITIQAPERLPNFPAALEVAAYRIATEAVTNVIRHAHARTCQVCLSINGQLTLMILDDGEGFFRKPSAGLGLLSMQERAEELGGTFEVVSNKNGTRVTAVLPFLA